MNPGGGGAVSRDCAITLQPGDRARLHLKKKKERERERERQKERKKKKKEMAMAGHCGSRL